MDTVPLWVLILALALLILLSAFFAMSETALMAANKYRLRHLAGRGHRGAVTALWLLERTDRFLSLVLISNILLNAMCAALVTVIAIRLFGAEESVIAGAAAAVAFLLIVFAEVSPKIIGARYPEPVATTTSLPLKGLMRIGRPLISFVNVFVRALLWILRIRTGPDAARQRLSQEELRSVVLEGGSFIPQKHRSILLNLFDLESVKVGDIMSPRARIEALDLDDPFDTILAGLANCVHNTLPVYEGEINRVIGILHVRKAASLLREPGGASKESLRALLAAPYFILEDTRVLDQLQYFQEARERLGVVVDEYGEVQGLLTLDDIIEEMIGSFTTQQAGSAPEDTLAWDTQGACLLDGGTPLRDINKQLGLDLPLDGPRTVNGLLLEALQEIPEAPIALKIGGCVIEVLQVQDQAVKRVKLLRPAQSRRFLVA
ncbi:HlyC/CorC family transporter [Massilia agri]|uniref:HlyC/CorC family transporter n=1 Tax=Massilia agri TaxID=1886785 RepID=A0ABT2AKG7_9BURK|nr:HlyC/CorC family transporter [Massilia agri]MCS0596737.1 HlyC/CorC family transporter [Massilia agri]